MQQVVPWFDSCWTMIRRFVVRGVLVDREQFLQVLKPTGGMSCHSLLLLQLLGSVLTGSTTTPTLLLYYA